VKSCGTLSDGDPCHFVSKLLLIFAGVFAGIVCLLILGLTLLLFKRIRIAIAIIEQTSKYVFMNPNPMHSNIYAHLSPPMQGVGAHDVCAHLAHLPLRNSARNLCLWHRLLPPHVSFIFHSVHFENFMNL
jgi:hypothetical protein